MQKRRLLKLPTSINEREKEVAIGHRWLPKPVQRSREIDLVSLHEEIPSLKLMPKYERFSSVCHLTDFKKAKRVVGDGGLTNEKRRFYSPLVNKTSEIKGVPFVANTEGSVEGLKSKNSENLQVKWLIGSYGDSCEFILYCECCSIGHVSRGSAVGRGGGFRLGRGTE